MGVIDSIVDAVSRVLKIESYRGLKKKGGDQVSPVDTPGVNRPIFSPQRQSPCSQSELSEAGCSPASQWGAVLGYPDWLLP